MKNFIPFSTAVLLLLLCPLMPAVAQWSANPSLNNAICTSSSDQLLPTIISDGSGGAIITWTDFRSGNNNIYAQRINASGAVQWTSNGVAICTAVNNQVDPTLTPDGSGGAIITWRDPRSGIFNNDIYAQRIDANGAVQWTSNGVAICTVTEHQTAPSISSDGSGGAIITWIDQRNGNDADIYAQRINAVGALQWTADGVAISTAASQQYVSGIISDDSGGAIISWSDSRSGSVDIYAQRIDSNGTVQWTADGAAVRTGIGSQDYPGLISDGSGGAIITWLDNLSGTNDVYAQRINASGAVQWAGSGVPVCTAADNQEVPTITSDGSGGAIITWSDLRSGSEYDLYAQRIAANGAVQWTANGAVISAAANSQVVPTIVSDGSGGAIITWWDYRGGNADIYAQRISGVGVVQWTSNGVAIATAVGNQTSSRITSNGSGGAIITWEDYRGGATSDVYAARVFSDGSLPVELVTFAAAACGSFVMLNWNTATEVNNYGFEVERKQIPLPPSVDSPFTKGETSESSGGFIKAGFVEGNGTTSAPKDYSFNDKNLPTGKYAYRLKQIDRDGRFEYSQSVEVTITRSAPIQFALAQNYPNPFNPTTTIRYSLPDRSSVRIVITNVLGQQVATLENGEREAGINEVQWRADVASGIYFYRIEATSVDDPTRHFVDTKKMLLLR